MNNPGKYLEDGIQFLFRVYPLGYPMMPKRVFVSAK